MDHDAISGEECWILPDNKLASGEPVRAKYTGATTLYGQLLINTSNGVEAAPYYRIVFNIKDVIDARKRIISMNMEKCSDTIRDCYEKIREIDELEYLIKAEQETGSQLQAELQKLELESRRG